MTVIQKNRTDGGILLAGVQESCPENILRILILNNW
jgi:hypothetical protein